MTETPAMALYKMGVHLQRQFRELEFDMQGQPDNPRARMRLRILPAELWGLSFTGEDGSLMLGRYDTFQGIENASHLRTEDLALGVDQWFLLPVLVHEKLMMRYEELIDSARLVDDDASNEMAKRGLVALQRAYAKAEKRGQRALRKQGSY